MAILMFGYDANTVDSDASVVAAFDPFLPLADGGFRPIAEIASIADDEMHEAGRIILRRLSDRSSC